MRGITLDIEWKATERDPDLGYLQVRIDKAGMLARFALGRVKVPRSVWNRDAQLVQGKYDGARKINNNIRHVLNELDELIQAWHRLRLPYTARELKTAYLLSLELGKGVGDEELLQLAKDKIANDDLKKLMKGINPDTLEQSDKVTAAGIATLRTGATKKQVYWDPWLADMEEDVQAVLERSPHDYSYPSYTSVWRNKQGKPCLFDFAFKVKYAQHLADKQFGTAQKIVKSFRYLKYFLRHSGYETQEPGRFLITELTPMMLDEFRGYLGSVYKHKQSTQNEVLKKIKSVIALAVRKKVITPMDTDVADYSIGTSKHNAKSKLTTDDVVRLWNADFADRPDLDLTRNFFLFIYLCNGIRVGDGLLLRFENVTYESVTMGDKKTDMWVLRYKMKKNDKLTVVPLQGAALEIYNRYLPRKEKGERAIFPFVSNEIMELYERSATPDVKEAKECLRLYDGKVGYSLNTINRNLKEMAEILGIGINLTTHIARHSAAVHLKLQGLDPDDIRIALNHGHISTTQGYLREVSPTGGNVAADLLSRILEAKPEE